MVSIFCSGIGYGMTRVPKMNVSPGAPFCTMPFTWRSISLSDHFFGLMPLIGAASRALPPTIALSSAISSIGLT